MVKSKVIFMCTYTVYNNLHCAFSSFEVLSLAFRVTAKFHRVMAIVCSRSEVVPVCVFALDDSNGGNSSISSSTLLDSWEQLEPPPSLLSCVISATNVQEFSLVVKCIATITHTNCTHIDTNTHTHQHTYTHYTGHLQSTLHIVMHRSFRNIDIQEMQTEVGEKH